MFQRWWNKNFVERDKIARENLHLVAVAYYTESTKSTRKTFTSKDAFSYISTRARARTHMRARTRIFWFNEDKILVLEKQ